MEPGNTPLPVVLLGMMTGYWQAKGVAVAAELGLADLLRDGPCTAASLAEICGVDADSLHRLLRALASVGVFVQTESASFALTPMAELLRSDRPDSMRALARMYGSEQYQAWGGPLDRSATAGRPSIMSSALRTSPTWPLILTRVRFSTTR